MVSKEWTRNPPEVWPPPSPRPSRSLDRPPWRARPGSPWPARGRRGRAPSTRCRPARSKWGMGGLCVWRAPTSLMGFWWENIHWLAVFGRKPTGKTPTPTCWWCLKRETKRKTTHFHLLQVLKGSQKQNHQLVVSPNERYHHVEAGCPTFYEPKKGLRQGPA